MGKCLKCGKETKASYDYFIGDIGSSYDDGIQRAVNYHNIEQNKGYLCYKCISKRLFTIKIIIAIIWAIFIIGTIIFFPSDSHDFTITLIITLIIVLWLFWTIIGIIKDKSSYNGEEKIVELLREKHKEARKWVFTKSEYMKLKKNGV